MNSPLPSRMKFFVDFTQPFVGEMCINLCRCDIHMSKHRLDSTQVGATVEQMCSKRMAHRMRVELAAFRALECVVFQQPPKGLT